MYCYVLDMHVHKCAIKGYIDISNLIKIYKYQCHYIQIKKMHVNYNFLFHFISC